MNTDDLRKAAIAVFLATEEDIAHDLSSKLNAAANEIDWLRVSYGWRPIETAPKDGTFIIAINAMTNKGRQHVVHFSERHSDKFPWVTDSAPMSFVDGLTHWMPLNPPPEGY